MSIIKDIFYGETDMQDTFCKKDEYRQALKELIDADNALRKSLTEEQIALLDEAKDRSSRLNNIISAECFANGFKVGVWLILEILCSDE